MNASEIEVIQKIKQEADATPHGGKEVVYQKACEQFGFTRSTLMRRLRQLQAVNTRKQRSDAGQVLLTLEDAQLLSATLMSGYRANKKKILSIKKALEIRRANKEFFATSTDPQTGELKELSSSACSRALRVYNLHPTQLNMPKPSIQQRSLHPNHVWLIDASISTLFYVPEGGVCSMSPAEFYKNKPENFERIKRQRLTRYAITDHTSGTIFVHYVAGGESTTNMAEAFLKCIQKRGNNPMHGVPLYLMLDAGSAGTSGAFGNLLNRLQIKPIVHEVGNPRASGQVEKAHHLIETDFESGFKFEHMESIDQINERAELWMLYYNGTRKHSRHGFTRFSKWMEITPSQLRTVDADLARSLLTHKPATPRVSDFHQVQFVSKTWDVSKVPQITVGQTVDITYNPFDKATAFVISHDSNGDELLIEVPEVVKDEHSFNANGAIIGQEYKQHADTPVDSNRKLVQRMITNTTTDEQAKAKMKGKAPAFDGALDPYKHVRQAAEQLPMYMPRQSSELATTTSIATKEPRVLNYFEAAKEVRSMGVEMSRERRKLIERLYPQGVPEDQLERLKQQLTTSGQLRVVGGEKQ